MHSHPKVIQFVHGMWISASHRTFLARQTVHALDPLGRLYLMVYAFGLSGCFASAGAGASGDPSVLIFVMEFKRKNRWYLYLVTASDSRIYRCWLQDNGSSGKAGEQQDEDTRTSEKYQYQRYPMNIRVQSFYWRVRRDSTNLRCQFTLSSQPVLFKGNGPCPCVVCRSRRAEFPQPPICNRAEHNGRKQGKKSQERDLELNQTSGGMFYILMYCESRIFCGSTK